MVFPGEQSETWTWHKQAEAWYYHRFYDFQPDLNFANPAVRAEVKNIMAFWLQLGVAGFRIDALPFIIELKEPGHPEPRKDYDFITELRQLVSWRRGDALLLAEANVDPDQLLDCFTDGGGSQNRVQMLFDFMLNGQLALALARQDAEPIVAALRDTPSLPPGGQWATFLRNHDEIDLSRLTAKQRQETFAEFGPKPNMRLYDRGIRRRLAPMLGNDRRRLELAYSLQFTLRGTPVLRYGDEIGMGENLALPGRDAIRTPMQWSSERNGGFSTAPARQLHRPVIARGEYGYQRVNVSDQRHHPDSLLSWFERMIATVKECPEIGCGQCGHVDLDLPAGVLVHTAEGDSGSMVFLHNLAETPATVDIGQLIHRTDGLDEVFADHRYPPAGDLTALELAPYGYRWIRLTRTGR